DGRRDLVVSASHHARQQHAQPAATPDDRRAPVPSVGTGGFALPADALGPRCVQAAPTARLGHAGARRYPRAAREPAQSTRARAGSLRRARVRRRDHGDTADPGHRVDPRSHQAQHPGRRPLRGPDGHTRFRHRARRRGSGSDARIRRGKGGGRSMTDVAVLERLPRVTPLGVRLLDFATGSFVADGLVADLYPSVDSERRTRAIVNRASVFVFNGLPGMSEVERGSGDEAYWAAQIPRYPFVLDVQDTQNRFLPFTLNVQ